MRFNGFNDKLLDLFQTSMKIMLSFCGQVGSLPDTIGESRFSACLEVLQRRYKNSCMSASDLSTNVRVRALRPTIWSAQERLESLRNIDVASFTKTTSAILGTMAVEAFFHGNADTADAEHAKELILNMLNKSCKNGTCIGLPRKKYPAQSVLQIPFPKALKSDPTSTPSPWLITVPSKDPTEPNTAVEVYIQVGKDKLEDRVMIDLLVHMMDEPLYDHLRTREQLGYHVSIASRWTCGITGLCVKIITATHASDVVLERVETFWRFWRQELETMSNADFVEHLSGLATQKLDRFDGLSDETDSLWEEIADGRFEWQAWRDEAVVLRTITKEQVVNAFDTWVQPADPKKRRILVVRVIAAPVAAATDENEDEDDSAADESTRVPQHASDGRPEIAFGDVGYYVDNQVSDFRKKVCKQQTWGRINSKLS
jgi:nardilysin